MQAALHKEEFIMAEKNFGSIYDLPLQDAGALSPDIQKRTVFGPQNFLKDYVMRHFILPPHKVIPKHAHEWEHFMYVLSGDGYMDVNGEHFIMKTGNWVHMPGNAPHECHNVSDEPLEFFCIVPTRGDPHAVEFLKNEGKAD